MLARHCRIHLLAQTTRDDTNMILATKLPESLSLASTPSMRTAASAQLDLYYAALVRHQQWGNSASLMKPNGWLYVLISHGRPILLLESGRVVLNPGDFIIAGPECSIGWTGQPGAVSDRLVWLWRTGPRCVECSVKPNTYRLWKVNSRLWRDLEQFHALCLPELRRPDGLSVLALEQLHGAIDVAIARHLSHRGPGALHSVRMELAMQWMMQNLSQSNPVNGLSEYLQVSQATLVRMFRTHTGESPGACHLRMKMARAHELLVSDRWSVKDVASALGYRHPNDFSRAFKQFTGITPTGHLAKLSRDRDDQTRRPSPTFEQFELEQLDATDESPVGKTVPYYEPEIANHT
jgi:AraC-like DNA-binding protein